MAKKVNLREFEEGQVVSFLSRRDKKKTGVFLGKSSDHQAIFASSDCYLVKIFVFGEERPCYTLSTMVESYNVD